MEKEGPGIWYLIHRSALLEENIIPLIINYLPCNDCTSHAKKWLKNNPAPDNKKQLFLWTVKFHNHVNEKLNKDLIFYEDAKKLYELKPCKT